MFNRVINHTPFMESGINWHVHAGIFGDDVTFESTMRALLEKRVNGEVFHHSFYFDTTLPKADLLTNSFTKYSRDNFMLVRTASSDFPSIDNISSRGQNVISELKSSEYWSYIPKITEFYRKAFPVFCFVNDEHKHVLILTGELDYKKTHFLQCAIPISMPWYFGSNSPLSELEVELIRSLSLNDANEYLGIIEKIADDFDIRGEKIRSMLNGFESLEERMKLERYEQDLASYSDEINSYNVGIADAIRHMHDVEDKITALKIKMRGGEGKENEMMDYFLCNKALHLQQVSGSCLRFVVTSDLFYSNKDEAGNSINNPYSDIYEPSMGNRSNGLSDYEMKRLMTAIFLDETIKIKFCASFELDLHGAVRPLTNGCGSIGNDRLLNPHTNNYACMGNYLPIINDLIKERNYIAAIEQCIASCGSLNFSDSTVMGNFIRTMYGNGSAERFLRLPNDEPCTPAEAVQWLKANTEWEA